MKPGQSRPSSNESAVPETAPIAKRSAVALAQVLANCRPRASPVRSQYPSAISIIAGSAIPTAAKTMWNPSETSICARAAVSGSIAPPAGHAGSERPAGQSCLGARPFGSRDLADRPCRERRRRRVGDLAGRASPVGPAAAHGRDETPRRHGAAEGLKRLRIHEEDLRRDVPHARPRRGVLSTTRRPGQAARRSTITGADGRPHERRWPAPRRAGCSAIRAPSGAPETLMLGPILVGVDRDRGSDRALLEAVEWAAHGARLRLVHALVAGPRDPDRA